MHQLPRVEVDAQEVAGVNQRVDGFAQAQGGRRTPSRMAVNRLWLNRQPHPGDPTVEAGRGSGRDKGAQLQRQAHLRLAVLTMDGVIGGCVREHRSRVTRRAPAGCAACANSPTR